MTQVDLRRDLQTAEAAWMAGLRVPASWSLSRVKYLVRSMRAGDAITVDSIEEAGNYPVYGANGLRGFASEPTHRGTHVLIGRQGALCGNVHLVSGQFWASEHAIVATPADDVDERWFAALLNVMNLGQYSTSAAQPGIGVGQIAPIHVYVPPRDEQRAIADYLDHETAQIDALVAKQQEFIGLLRERRRAAVEAAVSTVEPNGQRLKHITRSVRQGWSPQCYTWPADGIERWAILKAGAANGGIFRPMENKELPFSEAPRPAIVVRAGDLVISRANTRELVGSAAVVDGDYPRLMLCDKLYAFDLDRTEALPRFIAVVLGSRRWRDLLEIEATGASSSMLNISQDDILNLPMRLPTVSEQQSILDELDEQTARIDALISKAEDHIALAKERRSALISAAVTGQIDARTARKAS